MKFKSSNKLKLILSPSEINSSVKRMEICNQIIAAIEQLTSPFQFALTNSIPSPSDIDTDLEFMKILNGIISAVNDLGIFFLA